MVYGVNEQNDKLILDTDLAKLDALASKNVTQLADLLSKLQYLRFTSESCLSPENKEQITTKPLYKKYISTNVFKNEDKSTLAEEPPKKPKNK